MNNLIYSLVLVLSFVFISDAHQNYQNEIEKRQFIAVPRVGRSNNDLTNLNNLNNLNSLNSLNQIKTNPSSVPISKILNHIYLDLLKRQGYIPSARVGRSVPLANNNDFLNKNKQQTIDFYSNLFAHLPDDLNNRFKRSTSSASAAELENADTFDNINNNLITNFKRQFLPPPRIGRSDPSLTKETVANQLTSNSIDRQLDDQLNNFGYQQDESNILQPVNLQQLLTWYKKLAANGAYGGEKRAVVNSRLGRSAPLTPRLGRSFWQLDQTNEDQPNENQISEHQDRQIGYYEPINSRITRTALTPRLGKRSTRAVEKVI